MAASMCRISLPPFSIPSICMSFDPRKTGQQQEKDPSLFGLSKTFASASIDSEEQGKIVLLMEKEKAKLVTYVPGYDIT